MPVFIGCIHLAWVHRQVAHALALKRRLHVRVDHAELRIRRCCCRCTGHGCSEQPWEARCSFCVCRICFQSTDTESLSDSCRSARASLDGISYQCSGAVSIQPTGHESCFLQDSSNQLQLRHAIWRCEACTACMGKEEEGVSRRKSMQSGPLPGPQDWVRTSQRHGSSVPAPILSYGHTSHTSVTF